MGEEEEKSSFAGKCLMSGINTDLSPFTASQYSYRVYSNVFFRFFVRSSMRFSEKDLFKTKEIDIGWRFDYHNMVVD